MPAPRLSKCQQITVSPHVDRGGDGSRILAILAIGQAVNVLLGSSALALAMSGFQKQLTIITLATSALTVGAEILVATPFGTTGVAVVSALGTVAWNVALTVAARRVLGIWTIAGLRVGH